MSAPPAANGRTLYVSDLDGTLLGDDERVSARSAGLLRELIEDRGVAFTLATARSFGTARRAVGDLPLRLPLAVYGGAFVVEPDGGLPSWRAMFEPVAAEALIALCEQHLLPPLVFWLRGGDDRISWRVGGESDGVRRFLTGRQGDRRLLPAEGWGALDAAAVFFVSVVGEAGALARLAAAIRASAWGATCSLALQPSGRDRRGSVLDVTAATATKGLAVRRIAAAAGLTRVVAFGDGPNDVPMFEAADESHAVADASPEAREAATDSIGANDADGVAEWLYANAVP